MQHSPGERGSAAWTGFAAVGSKTARTSPHETTVISSARGLPNSGCCGLFDAVPRNSAETSRPWTSRSRTMRTWWESGEGKTHFAIAWLSHLLALDPVIVIVDKKGRGRGVLRRIRRAICAPRSQHGRRHQSVRCETEPDPAHLVLLRSLVALMIGGQCPTHGILLTIDQVYG